MERCEIYLNLSCGILPEYSLDSMHTSYLQVVSGSDVITEVEHLKVDGKSRPIADVTIIQCGELVRAAKKRRQDSECVEGGRRGGSVVVVVVIVIVCRSEEETKKRKSRKDDSSSGDSSSEDEEEAKENQVRIMTSWLGFSYWRKDGYWKISLHCTYFVHAFYPVEERMIQCLVSLSK